MLFYDILQVQRKFQQKIGQNKLEYKDLFFIFVNLNSYGNDEFFILKSIKLQEIVHNKYNDFLKRNREERPSGSTHAAVNREDLLEHKDNWEIIWE